jgi:response regulator RpfG family c-di-GMP phosphodiesterase
MTRPFSKRTDRNTQHKRSVLLVEGVSAARDRHSKTLDRNGYQVVTADTIEAAQNLFAPHQYSLLVVSLNGFGAAAAQLCSAIKEIDPSQVIALIFHPDQELPATDCPTLIFTTEPDEYFLARVETLTAPHAA